MKTTDSHYSKLDCINRVELVGTVINKASSSAALAITMAVDNSTNHKADFPVAVALDDSVIDALDPVIKVKDRIHVTGYIATNKKHPAGTIVITDFEKLPSRIDAAFSGQEYASDKNMVLFQGELSKDPYINEKCVVITVKLIHPQTGHAYYPEIVCFNNKAEAARKKKKGDIARVMATIRTQIINSKSPKKLSRQSLIAQDIK